MDAAYEQLIRDEALRLSAFEIQCALAWPGCNSDGELARKVYLDEYADLADAPKRKFRDFDFQARRRVRWAVQRAAERVREVFGPEMFVRATERLNRDAFEAVRGVRDRGSADALVGIHPYANYADLTPAEYRAALQDPREQYARVLRSPLVTSRAVDFEWSAVDCLQRMGERTVYEPALL